MNTMLNVINTDYLPEVDKNAIDEQIDSIILKHKDNRYEINKLVLESVSTLTASENYSAELLLQGKFKCFWSGITGKNRELQRNIDSNIVASQYASQRTLQKLAEQNLMSFELITAVNNRLNVSLLEVETEINKIYDTLVTFFKQTKSNIIQLENRVERLERNVALLNWHSSIEYQMWNGVEYADLDVVSKLICMVRDFYDITKGNWTTSDLLLLKSALAVVGLNPRELINYGDFIKALYTNESLCQKLFQDELVNDYVEPWFVAISSAVNKGNKLQGEEAYIVHGVTNYLTENNIETSPIQVVDKLVSEYSAQELRLPIHANVIVYDLMLEMLFNLEQLKYPAPKTVEERLKEAENEFLKENHELAFPMFESLAEEKCGRAMYYLGEYYRQGYGNLFEYNAENTCIGYEWHKKGAELGDALAILNTAYLYEKDSAKRNSIVEQILPQVERLAEKGDPVAQNELSDICADRKEKIYWLKKSAELGYWRSQNKLGDLYYTLGKELYGKEKTEEEYYRAIQYFMKAAELGSANAMGYIALMYGWGYGFAENKKECLKWEQKAAEAGSVFSMRNRGTSLYTGWGGCNIDKEESKQWYMKAAKLGDEDAKEQLKEKFGIEV